MKIDPYRCTMEQIDPDSLNPQEVADTIFEAAEHRMENFRSVDGDMHYPLNGMTASEREYLQDHADEISQNLETVSRQRHLAEIAAGIHQLIADAQKRL